MAAENAESRKEYGAFQAFDGDAREITCNLQVIEKPAAAGVPTPSPSTVNPSCSRGNLSQRHTSYIPLRVHAPLQALLPPAAPSRVAVRRRVRGVAPRDAALAPLRGARLGPGAAPGALGERARVEKLRPQVRQRGSPRDRGAFEGSGAQRRRGGTTGDRPRRRPPRQLPRASHRVRILPPAQAAVHLAARSAGG